MEAETTLNLESKITDLSFSNFAMENLRKTASWAQFMSILGFISCGFIALAAIGMLLMGSTVGESYAAGLGALGFILYVVLGVIMLFPCLHLNNFARNLKRFCQSTDKPDLEIAFDFQRKYWQLVGVYTIIGLAITFISLLIVVAAA
jgi:hypothetical protein